MSITDPARHQALHAFFAGHHGWLLGALRRRLRNQGDAEDITSETFLQVVDSRINLGGVEEPRAFLTTIAKRVLFHFRRRQALERDYMARLALLPAALAPSTEEQALVIEAIAQIDRVLHGLPAPVKEAFLCSQLEDMPHEAIAQRLGLSTRTVARHITRALTHCVLADVQP
jgi:RNA polymerase sigma-70 factor (ECF subfamily)